MKLYFTELEKRVFLEKRGYTIKIDTIEEPIHVHGSRFLSTERTVIVAYKIGSQCGLDFAFHQELKKALLAL